jgi:hypothetical protein
MRWLIGRARWPKSCDHDGLGKFETTHPTRVGSRLGVCCQQRDYPPVRARWASSRVVAPSGVLSSRQRPSRPGSRSCRSSTTWDCRRIARSVPGWSRRTCPDGQNDHRAAPGFQAGAAQNAASVRITQWGLTATEPLILICVAERIGYLRGQMSTASYAHLVSGGAGEIVLRGSALRSAGQCLSRLGCSSMCSRDAVDRRSGARRGETRRLSVQSRCWTTWTR